MKRDFNKITKELATSFLKAFRAILQGSVGINTKVNKNTLQKSRLSKDAHTAIMEDENDVIAELLVNDYIQFIESGRRKGAKFPPVAPIVQWCRKNGIPTDNSTIFLIRRAISRDGIPSRTIMTYVYDIMDNEMETQYYDRLFDTIVAEINNFFNKK